MGRIDFSKYEQPKSEPKKEVKPEVKKAPAVKTPNVYNRGVLGFLNKNVNVPQSIYKGITRGGETAVRGVAAALAAPFVGKEGRKQIPEFVTEPIKGGKSLTDYVTAIQARAELKKGKLGKVAKVFGPTTAIGASLAEGFGDPVNLALGAGSQLGRNSGKAITLADAFLTPSKEKLKTVDAVSDTLVEAGKKTNFIEDVKESTTKLGKAYEGIPRESMFTPDGRMTPDFAEGRIRDVAGKLDIHFPGEGRGDELILGIGKNTRITPKQLQEAAIRVSKNKSPIDVNAIIPETEATRSRAKQFGERFQQVRDLESDPQFLDDLKARGGGRVVSNEETFTRAAAQGPLPKEQLLTIKEGAPVSTVDVVRAKMAIDDSAKKLSDALKSGDIEQVNLATEEFKALDAGYTILTAEPGRATQVQSTFVDDFIKRAQKITSEGPIKTQGQLDRITKEVDELGKLTQSSKVGSRLRGLYDGLVEYSTSAKLTAPQTLFVNNVSNSFTFLQRIAEQTLSVGKRILRGQADVRELGSAFGTTTGWRTATWKLGRALKDVAKESLGSPSASKQATESLGQAGQLAGKADIRAGSIPGRAGKIIRLPFRFLQISDDFGKTILKDSEISRLSYSKAFAEGLRGKKLIQRAAEFMGAPTDDMLKRSVDVAKEYTFQSDPGESIKYINRILTKTPGGKIVIPFVSTPSNIIKFQLQRSLLGIFSPRNIKEIRAGGVARDEAVARLTIGTLMTVGAVTAGKNNADKFTGAAPTTESARDKFYREGKRPWSVKVGNVWIPYNRFGPVGIYLTQVLSARDSWREKKDKNAWNFLGSAAFSFAKGLSEIPFVQGVSSLTDALNDPERYGAAFIQRTASGMVPNISRNIRLIVDPKQRKPESVGQAVIERIPGLSQRVPERVNYLGGTTTIGGNSAERLLLPNIAVRDTNTPIEKELTRIGYTPGSTELVLKGQDIPKELQDRYQKEAAVATGKIITGIVNAPLYKSLSSRPDAQAQLLKFAVDKVREQLQLKYKVEYIKSKK